MAEKNRDLGELVREAGVREAVDHKFLALRDRYPLLDRLFSEMIIGHISSTSYARTYIASWDGDGRLMHFNPNPQYPEDFRPIDPQTGQPATGEPEVAFPTDFARAVSASHSR